MRPRTLAGFATLALLWGSEWMLLPVLQWLPPLQVAALRCGVAALALSPWAVRSRGRLRCSLGVNALLGVTLIAVPQILEGWRPSAISPGLVLTILAAIPLLTAVLEGSPRVWFPGALLGLAGISFVAGDSLSFSLDQWPAAVVFLVAAGLISVSAVIARRRLREAPVGGSVFVQMSVATLVLGVASLWESPGGQAWSLSAGVTAALSGLCGSALGYVLFLWLLQRMDAVQVGALRWMQTVVATAESALLLRQQPGWQMGLGLVVSVASTVWLMRSRPEEEATLMLQITGGPPTAE